MSIHSIGFEEIVEFKVDTWSCRVLFSHEWIEFEVRVFFGGQEHINSRYFTDDKEDAISTAMSMCASKVSEIKNLDN